MRQPPSPGCTAKWKPPTAPALLDKPAVAPETHRPVPRSERSHSLFAGSGRDTICSFSELVSFTVMVTMSDDPTRQSDNAEPNPPTESSSEAAATRRKIKIGSQREDYRPVKRSNGIEETWSGAETPPAAEEPQPAPQEPQEAPAAPAADEPQQPAPVAQQAVEDHEAAPAAPAEPTARSSRAGASR